MSNEAKLPPPEADGAWIGNAPVDGTYFVNGPAKSRRSLPKWLDHFNAKDLKMLFKASAAVWIMSIFIFIGPTLDTIGSATFLGCIVLFIAPPSGVVFLNLLAGVTICIGVCLGWAWGVITSKAALATRPQADLNARYAQLQQMIAQNTTAFGQPSGQVTYAQLAIYNGFMLDTRVTTTYFCMTGLFIYFMARLRVAAPKLSLIAMFAMIVSDLYLTTVPLLPTFQGTVPKTLVLPVAIAVGVGVVCNLLIFPRSTASIVRDGMQKVLDPMSGFIEALDWHFKSPETRFNIERLQRMKTELVAAYKDMDGSLKFLPMDFSYSSWSPEDITSLQEPLRQVLVTFGELSQVSLSRERSRISGDALVEAIKGLEVDGSADNRAPIAYHQIARSLDLRQHNVHPETEELSMHVLKVLSTHSSPLFQTWLQAFEAANRALLGHSAKSRDSGVHVKSYPELMEALKKAQHELQSAAISLVLEEHSDLFDSNGNLIPSPDSQPPPILIPLMLALLFQARITNFSGAILSLLERVADIDTKRSKSCLWLPKGIRSLLAWGVSSDDTAKRMSESQVSAAKALPAEEQGLRTSSGNTTLTPETKDDTSAAALLESMRNPSGRQRTRASRALLAVVRWLSSDEGLHGLRTLVVTIGLSCVAVIPSTAGFFYREKGMWAVVMGQLTIVPYTSDFVSSLIVRVVSTVVGGILGMVCWYIGSGSGPGNPYGLAAVMAVVILAMMWWRLFAPADQIMAGIMLVATMYLIVTYSWIDTHNPTYGNPGVGYAIFWRRLLLVLIGFAVSTFVMFFPRPPSGSRHHRQLFAESLSSIRDCYALFVSTWHNSPSDLAEVIEKEAIMRDEILRPLMASTKLLKFEFSTSNINADTLGAVCDLCMDMNIHITQLVLSVGKLSPELRSHFMRVTNAGVESLFADVMAVIALIEQSLVSGSPLPSILPAPLLGRFMNHRRLTVKEPVGAEHVELFNAQKVLTGEEGPQWVSSIDAFLRLLVSVDALVIVIKSAVGEGSGIDLAAFGLGRV